MNVNRCIVGNIYKIKLNIIICDEWLDEETDWIEVMYVGDKTFRADDGLSKWCGSIYCSSVTKIKTAYRYHRTKDKDTSGRCVGKHCLLCYLLGRTHSLYGDKITSMKPKENE